jgi:hypothetical protein
MSNQTKPKAAEGAKARAKAKTFAVLFVDWEGKRCLSRYFTTERAARHWAKFLQSQPACTAVEVTQVGG